MIKKICMDWGNTICAVTGEYSGPMIDWPEITLMDGARQALATLVFEYDLYIATNAKESTPEQINAVMERVQCAEYFQHIFTPHEIGMGKEDPSYYQFIAQTLQCSPSEILMVGDDYNLDTRNAWEAGFQTAYYNPTKQLPHGMYFPLHQYEAASWAELIRQIPVLRPSLQESLSWLQRENESYVLLQHIQTVAAIAYWFAVFLRQNDVMADAILTHRAGMLHDLDKLSKERGGDKHGEAGAKMLRTLGYPELAEIVGSHVIDLPENVRLGSKEAELVFFADKLVKHNQIVSVEERFADLKDRYQYPDHDEFWAAVLPFLEDMQHQLCEQIKIAPDHMLDMIRSDLMGKKTH